MKFAPIVPTPMLDHVIDGDYHMVLAHRLGIDDMYRIAYTCTDSFEILDNGVAEGKKITNEQLIDLAYYIDAAEVVAPDVMHETKESIQKLVEFMSTCPEHIQVMAVMQARNWVDFHKILNVALDLGVASIALPKLLTGWIGSSARLAAAEMVRDKTDLPIHCLGCSKHLTEAIYLAKQGIVRGIDSAAPVVLGLQGLPVKGSRYDWEQSHSALPDFWKSTWTEQIGENLDTFREWCESETSPSED